jgi:hypothetical protein
MMTPAEVAARLGGRVVRDYGPPGDPVDALMAAGWRVALVDGRLAVTRPKVRGVPAPVTEHPGPERLAELAAEVTATRSRIYGRALARDALTAPCPGCRRPTTIGVGWPERPGPVTPCTACRVAAALRGAVSPAEAPDPGATQSPTATPGRQRAASVAAPAPAPAGTRPAGRAWRVRGHLVTLYGGVLTVDGRAVAEGVDPAAVSIVGRRLVVAGTPVADLAA